MFFIKGQAVMDHCWDECSVTVFGVVDQFWAVNCIYTGKTEATAEEKVAGSANLCSYFLFPTNNSQIFFLNYLSVLRIYDFFKELEVKLAVFLFDQQTWKELLCVYSALPSSPGTVLACSYCHLVWDILQWKRTQWNFALKKMARKWLDNWKQSFTNSVPS